MSGGGSDTKRNPHCNHLFVREATCSEGGHFGLSAAAVAAMSAPASRGGRGSAYGAQLRKGVITQRVE